MMLPDSAACGRALAAMYKYYSMETGLSSTGCPQALAFAVALALSFASGASQVV